MADRLLLESGAPDGYLLEDGSGVLLVEPPSPLAVTARHAGESAATAGQTLTSGAHQPTSNSLLLVFASVERNNHSTAESWAAPVGGGWTYNTLTSTGSYQWSGVTGFEITARAWSAEVGVPGSAHSVLVDAWSAGTQTGFYSIVACDITGADPTTPIVQTAIGGGQKNEGNTETGTVTLGATPAVGNVVVAHFAAGNDIAEAFGTPNIGGQPMTQLHNQSAAFAHGGLWYRIINGLESNATITCPDLGQSVGNFAAIAVEVAAAPTGGGTPTVERAPETDTATALVEHKAKVVAQSLETAAATALVQRKTRIIGQAIDTASATALVKRKARTVGQAAELGTAAALTEAKRKTVAQASESDTAGPVDSGAGRTIGQAAEMDTAATVHRAKALPVARAVETATGSPVTPRRLKAVQAAVEAATATALVELKRRILAQASESDTASALAEHKTRAVNRATELDTGSGILRPGQIGRATEADTAAAPVEHKAKAVNRATETGTATVLRLVRSAVVNRAAEAATATALFRVKLRTLLRATETDTAAAPVKLKATVLLQATEADSARAIAGGGQLAILGQVVESNVAFPITYRLVTPRPAGDVTTVPDLGATTPRPTGAITPAP